MAVEQEQTNVREPQIREYWRRYRRTARVVVILMEIVVTLIVGLALLFSDIDPSGVAFWATMSATLLATTALNFFILDFLLTPLRDLAMAVTNAAGEKPTDPLANPNAPRYSKNGFKPLLQFIYEHAHGEKTTTDEKSESPTNPQLKRLETALRETNTGFIVMDAHGKIQYANHAAPVKHDTNDALELELLFDGDNTFTSWLANCRETAVRSEQSWVRVPNRIVGDEERRIFNVTANYEKGSAAEVVVVAYDATGVFQPEDDELDFISFAAHELRGPITVIRGYLDVLEMELDDQLQDDQRELFKRLVVSANRLSGYINNILNTSKYDRRHLQVHLSEEKLGGIYDTIKDDMQLRAQSQRRMLSVDLPSSLPTIAADRSSIGEVLSNLIDNALKYSNDGGSVSVTAATEGNFVKVSVTDNGIGIPSSVIGNLFHKFYRSHRSRETVAGTGIGLYLCKAIVESHGGQVGVTSTEGQGSTFTFTVPIYASVKDKLQANDYTNAGLISSSDGWIKNHSKYIS